MSEIGTLLYSPGVRVVIQTAGNGIIDVSEDLQSGNLVLVENQPSSFTFVLINHRRKYDGVFTPNDTISVQMKRIHNWMPVFAGYLDQVPYYSVYPRSIEMKATCTLKRLKYRLWDPGATASTQLLRTVPDASQEDGGMRDTLIAVLTKVAKWPKRKIHVGRLPEEWAAQMEPLRKRIATQIENGPGTSGTSAGQNAGSGGTVTYGTNPTGGATVPRIIPKGLATSTLFGGRGTNGRTDLTFESISIPNDEWACQMRWPYADPTDPTGETPIVGLTYDDLIIEKDWWRDRRILVTNAKNFKSVVLRAADWGPKAEPDVALADIGLSKHALNTVLEAKAGDRLVVRFASPGARLGAQQKLPDFTPVPKPPPDDPDLPPGGSGGGTPDTAIEYMIYPIEDPNGQDSEQDFGPRQTGQGFHTGIDLTAVTGTPVKVALSGIVETSYYDSGYGERILVSHGKGIKTMYAHLSVRKAQEGDTVNQGDIIGLSGATGSFAQGPHLHWEVWDANAPDNQTGGGRHEVDPLNYVHKAIEVDQTGASTGGTESTNDDGSGSSSDGGDGGLLHFDWYPQHSEGGVLLTGYRALINDTPVLDSIHQMVSASMRSFMSAPNGDFISWFPDYFGSYGVAAKMVIRDIELAGDGFTMFWNDENMVTHQFTAGSAYSFDSSEQPGGGAVDLLSKIRTAGIATVEFPELMAALFNVNKDDPHAKSFLDPDTILRRFGARMNFRGMGFITTPEAEFWYACRLFQQNWASQFSSQVSLTFMPEVWPGMLLKLETFGFQAYVRRVTHNFSFEDGGRGFTTNVEVIAPSATDGSGLYGLPNANKQMVATRGGNRLPPQGQVGIK